MPVCQACFDSYVRKNKSCPWGCNFPAGTRSKDASDVDVSVRIAVLTLSLEAIGRMETLVLQQYDNGIIADEEYAAKCEELRTREKELVEQLKDARNIKSEKDHSRLESLVREMGVSVKHEETKGNNQIICY
jgi:hypothetical protein